MNKNYCEVGSMGLLGGKAKSAGPGTTEGNNNDKYPFEYQMRYSVLLMMLGLTL